MFEDIIKAGKSGKNFTSIMTLAGFEYFFEQYGKVFGASASLDYARKLPEQLKRLRYKAILAMCQAMQWWLCFHLGNAPPYKIDFPSSEVTSSTAISPVALRWSRMGLISTTSSDPTQAQSAMISMSKCASR